MITIIIHVMYGMLSMSRRASNGEFKLKIRDLFLSIKIRNYWDLDVFSKSL
jgi:hypothetical protein